MAMRLHKIKLGYLLKDLPNVKVGFIDATKPSEEIDESKLTQTRFPYSMLVKGEVSIKKFYTDGINTYAGVDEYEPEPRI